MLVVPRKEILASPKVVEGAEISVIRPGVLAIPMLDYASAFLTHRREIRRQIEEFKPDILVGLGILNAHSGIKLARDSGIPFVYYLIDELHQLVPQRVLRGLARIIEQSNLRNASYVLAINHALRDYAEAMGAAGSRLRVLPAGIDIERYSTDREGSLVRSQLGLASDDLVLLFMGWVYSFSGIREVVNALASGEGHDGGVKLLLVGKGDIWDELATFVQDGNCDDWIKMVGFRPFAEVPSYLAASDICLLPALPVEAMRSIVPIKMYEYLAAGKPVIATELPGIVREFGANNGVVYVRSPGQVVSKAVELKRSGLLSSLGQQGRAFVSANDWKSVTEEFESVLQKLVNEYSGRKESD